MGYVGPCPPQGDGPHRYQCHLLALSIEHLPLKPQSRRVEIEQAARVHCSTRLS
ncbi:hypothetical protein GFM13_11505 [Rhizobium leguminosarum bv. viciae]|nr:hypothetical protein [Rhizobium leguminosarum bv. viciae]